MSKPKTTALMINIKNRETMLSAWMPFIYNGGVFIPTKTKFNLGDEVFLIAKVPGEVSKYTVSTKVAWISSQQSSGNAPIGVGLQLLEADGSALRSKIETIIAGMKVVDGSSMSI